LRWAHCRKSTRPKCLSDPAEEEGGGHHRGFVVCISAPVYGEVIERYNLAYYYTLLCLGLWPRSDLWPRLALTCLDINNSLCKRLPPNNVLSVCKKTGKKGDKRVFCFGSVRFGSVQYIRYDTPWPG